MKSDELKTKNPIASVPLPTRIWTVKPQTTVYPIIAPLKGRFLHRDPEITTTAWIFQEASAHRMSVSFWGDVDVLSDFTPVFIEFDEPVFDAGGTLHGFVVSGERLTPIDLSEGNLSLVDTPKGAAATSFNKPQHKTVVFQSKRNPKKNYETIVYEDGTVSCNCPGWTKAAWSKSVGRSCKHTNDDKILKILEEM